MVSLIHLANFNSTNIGNGALALGLERVVAEDFGAEISWHREAWDDYTFDKKSFDEQFVDLVNAHDGLIVGGAVAINGRHYLRNAGMRVDLPLELWHTIRRPVAFYGISHRHWPGQPFHNLDQLQSVLSHLLDRDDVLFSVRNDGTKGWLEGLLGWSSERILEVPDPAMYVPATVRDYPEIIEGRPNVIIGLNGEDSEHRFAGAGARARIVSAIAGAMERIATEFDANLILVPHYLDDYGMIAEFYAHMSPQIAHQSTISTGLARVKDTETFYGLYRRADLAISMRVHSMSPAIGLGVPTLAVVTQDRIWNFLRDAALDDLMLDGFASDLEDRLYLAAAHALEKPSLYKNRFAAAMREMRERSRLFHARLADLFRN